MKKAKHVRKSHPYDDVVFIGWPTDRSAFIAICGEDYGPFDLLESFIHSQGGEIVLTEQERVRRTEMLDRILSRLEFKDHTYRYVATIRKVVNSAVT